MPFKDKSRYQSEEWKEYQRNYQRDWHQRNKAKRLAKVYERKAAIAEYIKSIKTQLCCTDCGEQRPATLQFHHLNPEDKMFNIGEAIRYGISLDKIKQEIQKCVVLCANCHAIRHFNMRNQEDSSLEIFREFDEVADLLHMSLAEKTYNTQLNTTMP